MSKKSNRLKTELIQILHSPDVYITKQNFEQYSQGSPFVSYFVYQQGINRKFEINIEPKKFGISYYSVVTDNGDKLSCYARPHAILHRPVVNDVLEMYNKLNLHYLIQQSKQIRNTK